MRPQSTLHILLRCDQEDRTQKPPLQTLHPWTMFSEGQSITFYLGMILERQQSIVSGDGKKIKSKHVQTKGMSKYKPSTCLQDTAFYFLS